MEDNETIPETVSRELREETGFIMAVQQSLGLFDFHIALPEEIVHHIAGLYLVEVVDGHLSSHSDGQDSSGAEWVDIDQLHPGNASPLVMKAVTYIKTGDLSHQTVFHKDWSIIT